MRQSVCVGAILMCAALLVVGAPAGARTGAPVDGNPWPLSAQGDFDLQYTHVKNVSTTSDRHWYLPAIIDNSGSKTMTIWGKTSDVGATDCRGVASTNNGTLTVGSAASLTGFLGGYASITTPAVTVASGGTFAAYCIMKRANVVQATLVSYSYSP